MTRRRFLLLSLCTLPAGAKGVLDWQRETLLIAESLARLTGTGEGRLYAIKPHMLDSQSQRKAQPHFHSHPIRGQAALQGRDTDLLLKTLTSSLRRGAQISSVSDCFEPHHGIRLTSRGTVKADLLICFECNQVYFYGKGRPLHGYLSGGREVFEQMARAYGLPASPGPHNAVAE